MTVVPIGLITPTLHHHGGDQARPATEHPFPPEDAQTRGAPADFPFSRHGIRRYFGGQVRTAVPAAFGPCAHRPLDVPRDWRRNAARRNAARRDRPWPRPRPRDPVGEMRRQLELAPHPPDRGLWQAAAVRHYRRDQGGVARRFLQRCRDDLLLKAGNASSCRALRRRSSPGPSPRRRRRWPGIPPLRRPPRARRSGPWGSWR